MEFTYHVWFSTKGRRAALDGDIGDDVERLFIETARRTSIQLMEMEAVADHVHLLVTVSGAQTLSSVMHQLKGSTARAIFLKFPELKLDLAHNSLWQKGYGWRKVAPSEVSAVRSYIRTQRDRPLRRDL